MKNLETPLKNINIFPCQPEYKKCSYRWMNDHTDIASVLIYVLDGSFVLHLDSETYIVGKNQMALLPANRPHSYWSIPSQSPTILWFRFRAESHEEDFFSFMGMTRDNHVVYMDREEVLQIYQEMVTHPLNEMKVTNYAMCCSLITRLVAMYTHHRILLENAHNEFQDIITYMSRHVAEDLSLDDLSNEFHFNPSYFVKKFKIAVGITPMKYFAHMRAKYAARLFETTEMSVTQVASAAGFSDIYYFIKYFERYMGISPKGYRDVICRPSDLRPQ